MPGKSKRRPTAPPGLGTAGRRQWLEILERYEFEAHELLVLAQICSTVDRLDALAAAVADRGVLEQSSQGLRASPLLAEERQQRVLLAKLITALGLPLGNIEGAEKGAAPVRGLYGLGS